MSENQPNQETLNKDLFQSIQKLQKEYFSLIENKHWKEINKVNEISSKYGVDIVTSTSNHLHYSGGPFEDLISFGLRLSGQGVNYGEITILKNPRDRMVIALSQGENQIDPINLKESDVEERYEDAHRRGRKLFMHNTNDQSIDVSDLNYYVLDKEGKIIKLPDLVNIPKHWSELDMYKTYEELEPGDVEIISSLVSSLDQRYTKIVEEI